MEPELKKVRSTGSMLPEHPRFFPGTHKARNYVKDVWILFEAICSVKIAWFINISPLLPVAKHSYAPYLKNTEFILPYNWWNIYWLYKKTQEWEDNQLLLLERLSIFFHSVRHQAQQYYQQLGVLFKMLLWNSKDTWISSWISRRFSLESLD